MKIRFEAALRILKFRKKIGPPQAGKKLGFHYVFYVFALIFSVSDTIFFKFLDACGAQIPIFLQELKDFGKSSQELKVWLPPPHPRGGGAL